MKNTRDVRIRDDEPAYVAHYWSAFQSERTHERWGEAIVFHVSAEDLASFPELEGAEVVALRVTDGEVHETSPEDAATER